MYISDFVSLFIDDNFTLVIYDLYSDREIWRGYASDLPDDYQYREICSIDTPTKDCVVTVNVEE